MQKELKLIKNMDIKYKCKIILAFSITCIEILLNLIGMIIVSNKILYSIFLLNIAFLTIYFFTSILNIIKTVKMEEMDQKLHNLETYNKTLSIMYDNIRGFRHDFSNFVQALDGYVQTNNMQGIKFMSKSIIKDCKQVNNMGILDPAIINNPAVYSIITKKYYLAKENNIDMEIEIMVDFNELKIKTYELCRILGILLDNAIEAANECNEKAINVKFVKDSKNNRKLIIIENTYNKMDIDLDKIYEKGYSTKIDKSKDHGLGLWTIRKILNKSNNLNLFTSKDEYFRQQLEIYE